MIKKILLSAILVVSAVQFSVAQVNPQPVQIEIKPIVELTYEEVDGNIEFVFTEYSELIGVGKTLTAGTLKVRANKDWTIYSRVDFLTSGLGSSTDFVFNVIVGGTDAQKTKLTANLQPITTGVRGAGNANNKLVEYQVIPGFEVPDGTYNVQVEYTLTNE